MVLILAGEQDPLAAAVRDELERRGAEHAVLGGDWASASRLAWTPDPFGGSLELEGRRVDLADLTGVLARHELMLPVLQTVEPSDEIYVQTEMIATTLGVLDALPCPVVNPPRPMGRWRPMVLGTADARAAGLEPIPTVVASAREDALAAIAPDGSPTLVGRVSSPIDDRMVADAAASAAALDALMPHGAVIVKRLPPGSPLIAFLAGDAVIGAIPSADGRTLESLDLPDELATPVRMLGKRLDARLLRVSLWRGNGRLSLLDVDALPLLAEAAPELRAAVAGALTDFLTAGAGR